MTLHTKISYLKSILRIVGCLSLAKSPFLFAMFFVLAELLGIAEEMPGAYKGTQTDANVYDEQFLDVAKENTKLENFTTVPALPGPMVISTGKWISCPVDESDCEPTLRDTGFNDPPTLR